MVGLIECVVGPQGFEGPFHAESLCDSDFWKGVGGFTLEGEGCAPNNVRDPPEKSCAAALTGVRPYLETGPHRKSLRIGLTSSLEEPAASWCPLSACTEDRPCEDTAGPWPPAGERAASRRELNQPALRLGLSCPRHREKEESVVRAAPSELFCYSVRAD